MRHLVWLIGLRATLGQRIHRGGIIRLTDYRARVFQLAAILPPSFLLRARQCENVSSKENETSISMRVFLHGNIIFFECRLIFTIELKNFTMVFQIRGFVSRRRVFWVWIYLKSQKLSWFIKFRWWRLDSI